MNLTEVGYCHPWVSFPLDLTSKAALTLPPSDSSSPLFRWAVTHQHHPQPFMTHTPDLDMKTIAWGQAQGQEDTKSPSTVARWDAGVRYLWETGIALQNILFGLLMQL